MVRGFMISRSEEPCSPNSITILNSSIKRSFATGARERFAISWLDAPNVMGAGGLQSLVKTGLPIEGKKIVVAGSESALMAVAEYLNRSGAKVLLIAEQASRASLARFGFGLLGQTGKMSQALNLKRQLSGVKYLTGCWPVAASGRGNAKLETVTMRRGTRTWEVNCDYLACGFHLVPNLELAQLIGCEITDGVVRVDEFQQTSVPTVYSAGEATGVGGLELSLVEGEIAGLGGCQSSDQGA